MHTQNLKSRIKTYELTDNIKLEDSRDITVSVSHQTTPITLQLFSNRFKIFNAEMTEYHY